MQSITAGHRQSTDGALTSRVPDFVLSSARLAALTEEELAARSAHHPQSLPGRIHTPGERREESCCSSYNRPPARSAQLKMSSRRTYRLHASSAFAGARPSANIRLRAQSAQ